MRPLSLTRSPATGQREENLLQVGEAQGPGWGGHRHPSDVSEGTSCSGSSGTESHKPGTLPSVYTNSRAPPAHLVRFGTAPSSVGGSCPDPQRVPETTESISPCRYRYTLCFPRTSIAFSFKGSISLQRIRTVASLLLRWGAVIK